MLNVPDTTPSGSATGNPRNKVALKRGRGLMDWVRLGHTAQDLAGTGGKLLKITQDELSKHNKRDDAWIALKGKVYNITPYFEFHPGGEDELMKGAGIDATDLFNQVHKWVNFQSMLQKCLVGTLEESKSFFSKPTFLPLKKNSKSAEIIKDNGLFPAPSSSLSLLSSRSPSIGKSPPASTPKVEVKLPPPKYDWFQTKAIINIAIYTKWKDIRKWHVIVVNHEKYLKCLVYICEEIFTIHLELLHKVEREFELKIGNESGKVDILLKKVDHGLRWVSIGKSLPGNNDVESRKAKEVEFVPLEVCEKTQVTHNSYLIELQIPHFVHYEVPVGHHVYLRIPDSDIVKPYTPINFPFLVESKSSASISNPNIKIYFKVYPDGSMTPELNEFPVGKKLHVSFPEGSFTMRKFLQATLHATHLVLLGAGTGITPLIRLMLEALKNEVKTLLVLFNKTEEDIPWKAELDAVVVTHPKLLRVTHVLSNPSSLWKNSKGHVRRNLLEELLPPIPLPVVGEEPEGSTFIAICGPNAFTKLGLRLLEKMGYTNENIFAFTG